MKVSLAPFLNDDTVKCWGKNELGQLGYGNTTGRTSPHTTATLNFGVDDQNQPKTAQSLVLGNTHACAILNDNSLRCWGYDVDGRLGVGGSGSSFCLQGRFNPCRKSPTAVNLGQNKTAKFVALGDRHTCAILNDDTVRCWGEGDNGRLGYDNTSDLNAPSATAVNLGTGRTALSLALGEKHTCAILDDYTVKCWGNHHQGALGAGAGVTNLGDGVDEDGQAATEMGDNLPIVELF